MIHTNDPLRLNGAMRPRSLEPATMKYEPYGRDYIKHIVFLHLKEQAGR